MKLSHLYSLFFLVYNWIFLPFFWLLLRVASPFHQKIQSGLAGRRAQALHSRAPDNDKFRNQTILIHSASLGEFEQAKPIIQDIRKKAPNIRIIASFFSPSGYEPSRSYKPVDSILYIPFDSVSNVRQFFDHVCPHLVILIRYDFWPNFLREASIRKIPIILTNVAIKPKNSFRTFMSGIFYRLMYRHISHVFTADERSREILIELGLPSTMISFSGDTRYDQVFHRSIEAKKKNLLPQEILKDKFVVVAGSTWREDEAILLPAFEAFRKKTPSLLIIVPHEPNPSTLDAIESETSPGAIIRFSQLPDYRKQHIILVDSIGVLMPLYRYGACAFVGGAFGTGLHNVLEPAAYGIPVFFGPRFQNSAEAREMVRQRSAVSVADSREAEEFLQTTFRLTKDKKTTRSEAERRMLFIRSNLGATDKVLDHVLPLLNTE